MNQAKRKQLRNELRSLARKGKVSQLKRAMSAQEQYDGETALLPKFGLSKRERRTMNKAWS